MQPILTIKDHVFGSCDDEPKRKDGSTNKIKRWENKSNSTIDKDNEDVMFSKLLKWSSDEEDTSGEGFLTSESTADNRSDRYSMNYRGKSSHLMQLPLTLNVLYISIHNAYKYHT